jgi:hypothetical protein
MEYTEADLAAVGKIQELKICSPAKAKEIYRKQVLALANPDVENRAELVLAAVERGANGNEASDEEVEETVSKKPKMSRNARRLAKKEKQAAKKAAKPKAEKKAKKPSTSTPRVEYPLAELSREVELTAVPETHLYTGNLFGKKHVIVWAERNRSTGAGARFQSVNVSESQLDEAKAYSKDNDLPVAVCCTVRVLGKLDQGYAVPVEVFSKNKSGASGFNLSGTARKAYAENGWDGVKFNEKKAEEKAA